nr:MAG TPA: hypothetical protein [Caudoviricetes sp.]
MGSVIFSITNVRFSKVFLYLILFSLRSILKDLLKIL